MLTDTHCHLDSSQFRGDLPAVIERARQAGVTRIVAIGCDVESSRRSAEIAEQHEGVWFTAGVHPCYVTDVPDGPWLAELRALAAHPRCVALGEMGLDYYHGAPKGWTDESYRARQADFFTAQLGLAAELGLNVVVHERDRKGRACHEEVTRLLAPWQGRLRAQMHCFIHPWEDAQPLIAAGHVISFTGIATYPHAPLVSACAAAAEAGAFMLETDAPYLTPAARKGSRNEPAFTRLTAERIAELRGIPLEQLAAETTAVADAFFRFGKA